MTSKEEQDIQFYRGSAINEYIQRLHLSIEEKRVIDKAIASAKSATPDLSLIQKSDAMLKKIADKKQRAKVSKVDEKELARAVASVNMSKYKAPPSSFTAPQKSNATFRWTSGLLVSSVLIGILSYAMKHQGKYTYEEAVEKCHEKNQVLPLTLDDFLDSGYRFGQPAEFWAADGKLMVTLAWGVYPPDPDVAGYSYICVDENGKNGRD